MTAGMVIVGAGEAGARAAMALREGGHTGPVTLIGAERHAPYERPPMSKELMLASDELPPKTIAAAERLRDAGIAFHPSTSATTLDPSARVITLSKGEALLYDKLLLATGANPRRFSGATGPNIAYLRTHEDALRIRVHLHRRDRIAIVGGGFIGLELAAAARQAGAEVTILEALPRLLTRGVPAEIAATIQERHLAAGVAFRFDAAIASIADGTIIFRDGTALTPDLIVIGIGATPETSLAAAAGLTLDNGIAVDDRLRTSNEHIYAAGDCCSFPLPIYGGRRVRLESWRSAQDLGALAARNMLGANEAISAVPWFWSDQYDLTLQIAGLPDEGEVTVRRQWDSGTILFHLKSDGRLVAASGLGIGNAVARDIRVAEMLIARRATPDADGLAKPDFKLKSLLAA